LFYHGHGEEEEELMSSEFQSSSLKSDDEQLKKKKNTNTNNNSVKKKKDNDHHVQIQRRRKRVRMLRPFSTRLKKKATASSSSSQQQLQQQQENKARLDEYEQRKAAWAAKYTSVSSLRTTFGTNKNKIFGDFDPFTTRRLYHTLLPRALLELRGLRDMMLDGTVKLSSSSSSKDDDDRTTTPLSTTNNNKNNDDTTNNVNNNNNNADLIIKQELKELAPLAYQARVAAKKYARERSRLPGRIGSMLYDGYRQWRRYGKWDNSGMSWDQVWAKYEDQVLGEVMEEMMLASSSSSSSSSSRGVSDVEVEEEEEDVELATTAATLFNNYGNDLDDEELTARICLRILERSVTTNEMVDKLFRRTDDEEDTSASLDENTPSKRRRRYERQQRHKMRILNDLQAIEQKFDEDIQELLRYSKFTTEEGEERRRKRQKGAFFWKKPMLSSSSASTDQANDDDVEVSSRVVDVTTSARGGTVDTINASVESSESNDVASALFSVSDATTTNTTTPKKKKSPSRKLARHEIIALRILATTKQRIASLQAAKED